MGRKHLFELEDFDWFPETIRNHMTDFLYYIITGLRIYKPIVPKLHVAMTRTGKDHIIDMCSGGSGPVGQIQHFLADEHGFRVRATVSDLFPNLPAFQRIQHDSGGTVDFIAEPVDATDTPPELDGFRTIFTAFHHFRPELGQAVLQDAVDKNAPIGVFELTQRNPLSIALVVVGTPLGTLLLTPFFKPFRFSRLVFTYLVPVVPFATLWDGFVSCLRTYSPDELRELVSGLDQGDRFEWDIGTISGYLPGIKLTYLIGTPLGASADGSQ